MPTPSQDNSPIAVQTPLGKDKLFLVGFSGREAISQLFSFQLEMIAANDTPIPFEDLLGKPVGVRIALPEEKTRFFQGIISRFAQGERDPEFTRYRLEMVPAFWLLTRRVQSRIFQHMTVKAILKDVLKGLDVDDKGIKGKLHERDYCVQYRESDFNFASRLMEEEGIYYYFKHTDSGHQMVLADTPQSHVAVPEVATVVFEPETGAVERIHTVHAWEKVQELRSGKYTLWDHCFELAHQHLQTEKMIKDTVAVGGVKHPLKVGGNDALEIYDFPGAYAQRFDGVDKSGGDQAGKLELIFEDNERTAAIRMQQEALPSLLIRGAGFCGQFTSGHKFTLAGHFNADGEYVLTGVSHQARITGEFRVEGGRIDFHYDNSFVCIPIDLPYRPLLVTPKPVVQGTQTAVVVGPEEDNTIFTDKYGRVKVKFHWDRSDKQGPEASCWIRVSNMSAGAGYGFIRIPRVGEEVIVDFLEGDPDQPIVIGNVFNSRTMPPWSLPGGMKCSGLKTSSTPGGGGYNEIACIDEPGKELIRIHGQYDQDTTILHDLREHVLNDRSRDVTNNETILIGVNQKIDVKGDRIEDVVGSETVHIGGTRTHTIDLAAVEAIGLAKQLAIGLGYQVTVGAGMHETVAIGKVTEVGAFRVEIVGAYKRESIAGAKTLKVGGVYKEIVKGLHITKITGTRTEILDADCDMSVAGKFDVDAASMLLKSTGPIVLDAAEKITLQCKGSKIELTPGGILIQGDKVTINSTSGNIELESAAEIGGVASTIVSFEGSNFALNSSGDGSLETAGPLTIKGMPVKINC